MEWGGLKRGGDGDGVGGATWDDGEELRDGYFSPELCDNPNLHVVFMKEASSSGLWRAGWRTLGCRVRLQKRQKYVHAAYVQTAQEGSTDKSTCILMCTQGLDGPL
jgi:hypothetical protein